MRWWWRVIKSTLRYEMHRENPFIQWNQCNAVPHARTSNEYNVCWQRNMFWSIQLLILATPNIESIKNRWETPNWNTNLDAWPLPMCISICSLVPFLSLSPQPKNINKMIWCAQSQFIGRRAFDCPLPIAHCPLLIGYMCILLLKMISA